MPVSSAFTSHDSKFKTVFYSGIHKGYSFLFLKILHLYSVGVNCHQENLFCVMLTNPADIIVHFLSSIFVYRVTERSDKPQNNMWHCE